MPNFEEIEKAVREKRPIPEEAINSTGKDENPQYIHESVDLTKFSKTPKKDK